MNRSKTTNRTGKRGQHLKGGGPRGLSENGSVAVEFALIAPILFLVVFGMIDFSRAYYTLNNLTSAVREGARYASSLDNPLARQDEVRAVVRSFALSFAQDSVLDSQISVGFDGQRVSVGINDFPFAFLTPLPALVGLSDVRFTRAADMKWERAALP